MVKWRIGISKRWLAKAEQSIRKEKNFVRKRTDTLCNIDFTMWLWMLENSTWIFRNLVLQKHARKPLVWTCEHVNNGEILGKMETKFLLILDMKKTLKIYKTFNEERRLRNFDTHRLYWSKEWQVISAKFTKRTSVDGWKNRD